MEAAQIYSARERDAEASGSLVACGSNESGDAGIRQASPVAHSGCSKRLWGAHGRARAPRLTARGPEALDKRFLAGELACRKPMAVENLRLELRMREMPSNLPPQ